MQLVLLGHSLGSFMVRAIFEKYPDSGIAGAILVGTAWMQESVVSAAKAVSSAVCRLKGQQYWSKLLHTMMFGGYHKKIEHPRTSSGWLTRDNRIVDAYEADPEC